MTRKHQPIADILARVGHVISSAAPFDPSNSGRRFTLGAPDGVSAVFLPPLLSALRQKAPGVDISVKQVLPSAGETSPDRAWRSAFVELEAREMDIAILPSDDIPTRFHQRLLYDEEFVIAMRASHPHAKGLSLAQYCEAQHLVVSLTGDPYGFVDRVLEQINGEEAPAARACEAGSGTTFAKQHERLAVSVDEVYKQRCQGGHARP